MNSSSMQESRPKAMIGTCGSEPKPVSIGPRLQWLRDQLDKHLRRVQRIAGEIAATPECVLEGPPDGGNYDIGTVLAQAEEYANQMGNGLDSLGFLVGSVRPVEKAAANTHR